MILYKYSETDSKQIWTQNGFVPYLLLIVSAIFFLVLMLMVKGYRGIPPQIDLLNPLVKFLSILDRVILVIFIIDGFPLWSEMWRARKTTGKASVTSGILWRGNQVVSIEK